MQFGNVSRGKFFKIALLPAVDVFVFPCSAPTGISSALEGSGYVIIPHSRLHYFDLSGDTSLETFI